MKLYFINFLTWSRWIVICILSHKPCGLPYTFPLSFSCSLVLTALMNSTVKACDEGKDGRAKNLNPFLLYFFRPLRPQACLTLLFLSNVNINPLYRYTFTYRVKLTIILLISISNSIESISINRGKIWQSITYIYWELMMMLTIYIRCKIIFIPLVFAFHFTSSRLCWGEEESSEKKKG